MHSRFYMFFSAFIFSVFLISPKPAHAVNIAQVCAGSIPAGWIEINAIWQPNQCGNPTTMYGNLLTIAEYDNLPVGASLTVCAGVVPAGWAVASTNWQPTECGYQYGGTGVVQNVATISHLSCVNESSTLCYPPQPAAISASPTTVHIPYGQGTGTSQISFSSGGSTCVWYQNTGGAPTFFGCGGTSGGIAWPYVPAGGTSKFWIAPSSTASSPELSSVVISGVLDPAPIISATPAIAPVPAGTQAGTTVINYNSNSDGYTGNCIWFQNTGGAATFYGCGAATGSITWPYVPAGGTSTFWITPTSTSATPVLASVVVHTTQLPSPLISASPTSITVPVGQTAGTTVVSYNANGDGYGGSCIWFQNTGGDATFYGCGGATGSITWPYVPKGGSSKFWITPNSTSATPVLATVTITAN